MEHPPLQLGFGLVLLTCVFRFNMRCVKGFKYLNILDKSDR